MPYRGVIIEESLVDESALKDVHIVGTKVEQVTEKHKTPWVKQWTLHAVEISEDKADAIAEKIAQALDPEHAWYADFKNNNLHYVIFRNRVFRVPRRSKEKYDEAKQYGLSLGIPEYQVDFAPDVKEWKR